MSKILFQFVLDATQVWEVSSRLTNGTIAFHLLQVVYGDGSDHMSIVNVFGGKGAGRVPSAR